MVHKMKVAAVQMRAELGNVKSNLSTAEALVREAFRKGAKWVILPEFFPSAVAFAPNMLTAWRCHAVYDTNISVGRSIKRWESSHGRCGRQRPFGNGAHYIQQNLQYLNRSPANSIAQSGSSNRLAPGFLHVEAYAVKGGGVLQSVKDVGSNDIMISLREREGAIRIARVRVIDV